MGVLGKKMKGGFKWESLVEMLFFLKFNSLRVGF
jgi:hypothetical protein